MSKRKSYSRPEIWRLAIFLQAKFSKASDWAIADKFGWYDAAREVYEETYRCNSPHVKQQVPIEAMMQIIEERTTK
jgi:hypothetical protein